jgi:NAD(P)-dependent dehydrogenase (short-subunit alcohol dehydrogenase family)
MDVTSEKNVKEMIAFTVKNYGGLDFACNNAGIDEGELVSPVELSKDRWDKILAVNLTRVYLCTRYELKYMLTQGYGAIVNIASVAGIIGTKGKAAYVATKHGIIGLTKTAALEVANKSVRINAVAPVLVNAGFTISAPEEFTRRGLKAQPIGRMAEAEEIASAVVWLCSDEASFVLGHTLILDGGMTIQ